MIEPTTSPMPLPCFMVNNLTKNSEEQCKFVVDNDCLEDEAIIDYVYLVYCELGYELRYAAISLIVFIVIILFLNLSAVADEFLCPSLLAVARHLRMSDSLAGVTLLAFGNGCPDIFASLAAASSNRPELIVGELLGAGIFCTSIVAGLIFIHSDFKLACRPLLRDAAFYLFAVYLIWLYCWDQEITFYGSLAFIVIYVIYLVVALSGQAIHSRLIGSYPIAETVKTQKELEEKQENENLFKWKEESLRRRHLGPKSNGDQETSALASNNQIVYNGHQNNNNNIKSTNSDHFGSDPSLDTSAHTVLEMQLCSVVVKSSNEGHVNGAFEQDLRDQKSIYEKKQQQPQPQSNANQQQVFVAKLIDSPSPSASNQPNKFNERKMFDLSEWDDFISHLNPIDSGNWNEISFTGKITNILRAPLLFATILTIPVVDYDKKNNNWCRLLNSMHCVTAPILIIMSSKWGPLEELNINLMGGNIPLKILILIPSIGLALFVFKTTCAHEPPKYHAVFAYIGFIMSVLWIYLLATEIISLLKTVGIVFSMTDTAIGLGILAWGNSLGDIVANLSLADAGYPRMALGASIGAPLLNLLLGFGLSFTFSLKPGESLTIEYSPTISLLCSTLAIVLGLLMLSTLAPPDKSKKLFGYLLICGYGIYFALAVCIECDLIEF